MNTIIKAATLTAAVIGAAVGVVNVTSPKPSPASAVCPSAIVGEDLVTSQPLIVYPVRGNNQVFVSSAVDTTGNPVDVSVYVSGVEYPVVIPAVKK